MLILKVSLTTAVDFNFVSVIDSSCWSLYWGVVGWCKGVVYFTSLGHPTDNGLQWGKACYPFILVSLSSLFLSFISSTIFFLPFSGRQHKMTHKRWHVIKPQHNQSMIFILSWTTAVDFDSVINSWCFFFFMPPHRMMLGHIVFRFSVRAYVDMCICACECTSFCTNVCTYIRDPVRLRLRHLYQVEFCSFIVRYPTAGASVHCGHISSWHCH